MSNRAVAAALSLALWAGASCQVQALDSSVSTKTGASSLISQAPNAPAYQTGFSAPQTQKNQIEYPGAIPQGWRTNSIGAAPQVQQFNGDKVVTPTSALTAPPAATTTTTTTTTTKGAAAGGKKKKPDEQAVLCESPLNTSKKAGWQRFENYITLKAGQEQLNPLSLTVTNIGFQAVRVQLSGRPIASEKDFKESVLTTNIAGAIGVGDNQIVISAFGNPGAKVTWRVTTPKPILTSVTPTEANVATDVVLAGRNFSTRASQVMIGDKQATIKTASTKSLTVTVPDGLTGDQNVIVYVGGIGTKPVKLTLKGAPQVISVDMLSSPPGQTITVTGKGFSAKQSENAISIGGTPAGIVSSSTTSITCVIPEMQNPQYACPITVKTNNVDSTGRVTIDIQRRVIENNGTPAQY